MAANRPLTEAVMAAFALNTEQEVWPENVELYEPCKDTILLTDAANCRSAEVYLKFCGLAYEVKSRRNAEFMSPKGNVPFLRADNRQLISDFSGITSYIGEKGFSASKDLEMKDRAEMEAYVSLVENSLLPAELYMLWWKKSWAVRTRQQYGSQFATPLNVILGYRKQWQICRHLKAIGWHLKTETEVASQLRHCLVVHPVLRKILDPPQVLEEFRRTCQALSEKLGNNRFFINDRPTELDALVFGHLHSVLTRYLPDDSLSSVVREHKNLENFVMRILREFFQ